MTAQDAKRAKQLAEMQRYEVDNDIVPGTSSHDGKQAKGGVDWEGAARMALARRRVGIELNDTDVEALRRHPRPRSSFTGEPLSA